MKSFVNHIKDAIDYALSDKVAILIISILMTMVSFVNKNDVIYPLWKLLNINLIIIVGYGSYVSWYTLKGSDKHPHFKNNLRRLVWEGFKKSLIIFIYSGGLWLLFSQAKQNYINENLIIAACWIILFALLYLCFIGGLLNRYLHKGKFMEAFHIFEIIKLLSLFDTKSLIKVVIAVIISQIFAASALIGFYEGLNLIEIIYSIACLFLTPFLYIATKRLIALNVYDLLETK